MKTISEYRAETLILLGDTAGRRYSEAQLDTAIRQALLTLKKYVPRKETVKVKAASSENREVVLNWCPGPDAEILTIRNEGGEILTASDYRTGQRTYLEFYNSRSIPAAGDPLTLELGVPHCIRGLDDSQTTTIPEDLFLTVCTGAAGYALHIRARSVTEVFGKRPEDTERLISEGNKLIRDYTAELRGLLDVFDPLPHGGFPV